MNRNHILVIGDIMLDHYLIGDCTRISPEAPVPVVNIKSEEWRLGGAANVANNLDSLGVDSTLIGIYGNDDNAACFDRLLQKKSRISNQLCKSASKPTTVKSRVLVGSHQMLRVDREDSSALNKDDEKALLDVFFQQVNKADVIVLSDYNKGVLSKQVLNVVLEKARQLDKTVVVDPKCPDFSVYKGASIIKPNRKEAEVASGYQITNRTSLEAASKKIQGITNAEAIITTLSEDGVALYTDNALHVIPTQAKQVFDVTGAGDTYLAAFCYNYLLTRNLHTACEFANAAAAIVISKIGSATVTIEEINQLETLNETYEPASY